jgi:signal transduction histidine kinase
MDDALINIANLLSFFFLLITLAVLLLVYKKRRGIQEVNLFYFTSFTLLLMVCLTNILEHVFKSAYFDVYEDSLEMLFIPFMVFAIYSSRLKNEFLLRTKAEHFATKVLNTSPAFTFIFSLKKGKFIFLSGNYKNNIPDSIIDNNTEPDHFFRTMLGEAEFGKTLQHFTSFLAPGPQQLPINEFIFQYPLQEKRYFQFHETVFTYDESGFPDEIVGVAIDVTDKKSAEQQLLDYQNHLESIVKERTIDLENTNNELKATNEQLHITNEELRVLNNISEKQGRKIESLNEKLTKKNQFLELINEELEDAMKKLSDVQNQLIQSEKLSSLGVLMAGIAHEINNPINYISNGLYGLKRALSQIETFSKEVMARKEDADHYSSAIDLIEKYELGINIETITIISGHIQTGISRILEIVASLRQYTRSGTENFEPADIHGIIDAVLIMLYHEYKNRIEIIKEFEKLPPVECQPGKIHQLIMNILTNSIQAIPGKGQIQIQTDLLSKSDQARIVICDTGTGISAEIKNKIFDPFFTTKQAGMGTGLGLSISYDIIQLHNGIIAFEPGEKGGTKFIITLPVHQSNKKKEIR